jgi:hypothetical protein
MIEVEDNWQNINILRSWSMFLLSLSLSRFCFVPFNSVAILLKYSGENRAKFFP